MGGFIQETYDDIVFSLIVGGWLDAKSIEETGCLVRRVYGPGYNNEVL